MRHIKLEIALTVFLAAALFAYAEEQTAPTAAPDNQTAPAAAADPNPGGHDHGAGTEKRFTASVGPDGIQHVEITGGEYYFDPNYIVVKVNVPVELKVKKAGGYIPHDIIVNAPDAGINFKVDLKKSEQAVVFTPTKVGKYEMYCDKKLIFAKSHKEKGMDGWIEVVP